MQEVLKPIEGDRGQQQYSGMGWTPDPVLMNGPVTEAEDGLTC